MWERYQKIRELSRGGMGSIWLVTDKHTRLPYAAKIMRSDLLREKDATRFRREVDALMQLDHPNIAKIYAATAPDEGPLGYVMEYCPEGDVAHAKDPNVKKIIRART